MKTTNFVATSISLFSIFAVTFVCVVSVSAQPADIYRDSTERNPGRRSGSGRSGGNTESKPVLLQKFSWPNVDWCMPNDCSEKARERIANAFCTDKNYARASSWDVIEKTDEVRAKLSIDHYLGRSASGANRWRTLSWNETNGVFTHIECDPE